MERLEILDSTLRDGAQGVGIIFSLQDMDVKADNIIRIVPSETGVIDTFVTLLKKFTLLAEGALTVYTEICPVCGSSLISPEEKDYACVACGSKYHLFYYAMRDLIWVKRLPKFTDEVVEEPAAQPRTLEEAIPEEEHPGEATLV